MIEKKYIEYNLLILLMLAICFTHISNATPKGTKSIYESNYKPCAEEFFIVTSLSIIGDLAYQLGRGLVTVTSIVTGSENPHIYEPTPAEIQNVAQADLFVHFGLDGLEPWIKAILDANPSITAFELVNTSMLEYDTLISADNPHVWMSPIKVKMMVNMLYQKMIEMDAENIASYTLNYNNYIAELDLLIERINQTKLLLNGTKIVEHHPAFKYLLDMLGVIRVGVIEEREGSEPSPDHILEIMGKIISENVSYIINQPQLDEKRINQIALDTNIDIAYLTPMLGVYKITNYIDMIDYNLLALQNPIEPKVNTDIVTWVLISIGGGLLISIITIVIIQKLKAKT